MELYIEGSVNLNRIFLSPVSKCALLLCKYPNIIDNVSVYIVISDEDYCMLDKCVINQCEKNMMNVNFKVTVVGNSELNDDYSKVDLPVVVSEFSKLIYSGPAAVFRNLVQSFYPPNSKIPIFGTAQSCLKACKERSKWTFYCERGIVDFINDFDYENYNSDLLRDVNDSFLLHKGILNMENYIMKKKDIHAFLEGPRMTLSDICISFYLLEYCCVNTRFCEKLYMFKRLHDWLNEMKTYLEYLLEDLCFMPIQWIRNTCRLQRNDSHQVSLIDGLQKLNISAKNITELTNVVFDKNYVQFKLPIEKMDDLSFDWTRVHHLLRPENSPIPRKRQKKKADQLLNMVICASKLVKPGMTIIDFCSGGGHLGLIMASIHKDCTIVLLENKEESLSMAEKRIAESGLDNVRLYKCNIYAYKGHFDIGLALHACGTVTDLVIEICLTRNANMVISPCCYGSIAPSPNVDYPRSVMFRQILSDVYSKWCHAADCCNAKPFRQEISREAMHLIDSDRSFYVSEKNYQSRIYKMIPEDCTPKNNILVFTKNVL